jgi:putative flippase GtrA
VLSAVCTYSAACCWSRIIFRDHIKRLLLFAAAGLLTTALGLGLYYVEVSLLDINKYAVRPVNWPLMTLISFLVNLLIFGSRRVSKKRSGIRWFIVAVGCSGCSFSVFTLLNASAGVQYLLAQVITGAIVGIPHYAVTHLKVFQEEPETA